MNQTTGIDFLSGGGEMGRRILEYDWAGTPIGPPESWSPALQAMVGILLANRFPLLLWWGPQYISIYNDAYCPVLGTKHPKALGQPLSECWHEIWHILQPLVDSPFQGGPATWMEDILLEINRYGFLEETHFTIAYSPVPDNAVQGGIGGVLATVHEITEKVVGERRVLALRDLGAKAADAKTAEEACSLAADTLAQHPKDIPFALLYLIDSDRQRARLAGTAGVAMGTAASPLIVDLHERALADCPWPLAEVVRAETLQVVENLIDRLGADIPSGPWSDRPRQAVVVPIRSNIPHQLAGLFVAGVSARLVLDDLDRSFFELISSQVATAIANARAYEEERKRAEALAEIDRAKTAFFSNVSHEFRTPLTLMLGPVEDMLAKSHTDLSPSAKGQLEVVNRNGLRLLRLVNSLLDFSRIEAGRVQARYEPTDLSAFTAELASGFRSATERAGLKLTVDCPALSEPVYVDRDMWEKIVLNLLSNAFKFTFEGGIEVSLRESGERSVTLRVRDTGVGIPTEEMPRLFERFHRVQNMTSRTHEGSGIGLALVQELAKLHGGTVRAESQHGQGARPMGTAPVSGDTGRVGEESAPGEGGREQSGSTFIVTVPLGTAHLPADRIGAGRSQASTAMGAGPFVEEALSWLPDTEANDECSMLNGEFEPSSKTIEHSQFNTQHSAKPRVLVVDDNADMRHYMDRLLAERYSVETAADGEAALAMVHTRRPDLILSDVMMPRFDGFGLLRALRADPATATVPVILLSARAGEESRIEGLQQGADDYLIKPFSARELLARVQAHLELARVRGESQQALLHSAAQFETLLNQAPLGVYLVDADFKIRQVNPTALLVFGDIPDLIGRDFSEVIHILWEQQYADEIVRIFRHTLDTGEPYVTPERIEQRLDRSVTEYYEWRIDRIVLPDGRFGVVCYFRDISAQVQAREQIRESEERFRKAFQWASAGQAQLDVRAGRFAEVNERFCQMTGYEREELLTLTPRELTHPDDWPADATALARMFSGETEEYRVEKRYVRKDGGLIWVQVEAALLRDAQGRPHRTVAIILDITERRRAEEALRESEEQYRSLFDSIDEGFCIIEILFDETGKPADYRFVQANPAFARLTGLEDAPGKTARELVPNLEQFWVDMYGKVALTGEAVRFENRSGAMNRWFDVYASRVGEAGSRLVAIVFTNVTERKAVQRRSEFLSRLSHMLATVSEPEEINRIATREIGTYLSAHRCYFFDVMPGGTEVKILPDWRRDDGPPLTGTYHLADFGRHEWWQAAQRGPIGIADVRTHSWTAAFAANYSPIDILAYAFAPFVHEGRWMASIVVSSDAPRDWTGEDMTLLEHAVARVWPLIERARVGQALRRLNEELEQRVESRTHALLRSEEQLRALATELNLTEQRERKRLATELHDHLAQLLALSKMKLGQSRRLAGPVPACVEQIVQTEEVLTEALTYTRTLVHDLSPPVLHEFGLPTALKWLGQRMERHELAVTVDGSQEDLRLPEDRAVLLFQSVRELLMNASKHAGCAEALVTLERRNGDLYITVKDGGKGFDPSAVVLGAESRGEQSSKFGLFSIRERMRALGGRLDIDSAPGRGTTATLVLPLRTEDSGLRTEHEIRTSKHSVLGTQSFASPNDSALSPQHSVHQQNAIRVLLVDDHAMVRQGLRSVLESYNDVEVVGEAANGEEALSAAERWRPAVVVMDINMPRKNGIEATAEIKARYPGTVVIGLSVNAGGANANAMAKAGAALLLTKEAAVDQLYRAIQDLLHRKVASGE